MSGKKAKPKYFDEYITSSEMQLLLACCKKIAGSLDEKGLLNALEKPFDESAFFKVCEWHGFSIPVYKVLVRPYPFFFSKAVAERFESESTRQTVKHLRLLKILMDMHREFDRENIAHLFLKGPVLGHQLFGEELLRYSKDIDVLIELKDIPQANEILRAFGIHPEKPLWQKGYPFSFHRFHNKDIVYYKEGIGKVLDLHWKTDNIESILTSPHPFQTGVIKTCAFQDETVRVLDDYYNCLYLCQHAAKHSWFRFRWLLDIPLFITKKNLDPVRLIALAKKQDLQKVVYEAFYLCEKVFGISYDVDDPDLLKQNGERAERRFQIEVQYPDTEWRTFLLSYYQILLYPALRNKLYSWFLFVASAVMRRVKERFFRVRAPMATSKSL